jgi:hypothetical protein
MHAFACASDLSVPQSPLPLPLHRSRSRPRVQLGITLTYVAFSQNPPFQLAASLLIVFLAYAAQVGGRWGVGRLLVLRCRLALVVSWPQVKYNPYMPPSEMDDVVRDHGECRAG